MHKVHVRGALVSTSLSKACTVISKSNILFCSIQLKQILLFAFIIMLLATSPSITCPRSPLEHFSQELGFAGKQGSWQWGGTRFSHPAMALGPTSGPEQQKGSLAHETEESCSILQEHPQKQTSASLVFPQMKERPSGSARQIMPQSNVLRSWLERKVPAGALNSNGLGFQPQPCHWASLRLAVLQLMLSEA